MSSQIDLVKAIRTGHLPIVIAALDAGAPVELNDGLGVPGLPLGVACFMGYGDIVRELVRRGAKVNLPDNREPISPLSMALRGGRTEIVKLLIELGALVPPGMECGLDDEELRAARAKAETQASIAPELAPPFADLSQIEEIEIVRCFGTDTGVLEADVIRAAQEMDAVKNAAKKS